MRFMTPLFSFFFFQAEDCIRDLIVTGVQTCALPILRLTVLWACACTSTAPGCSTPQSQDRKSVVEGKSVDLGGRRINKKKKKKKKKKKRTKTIKKIKQKKKKKKEKTN